MEFSLHEGGEVLGGMIFYEGAKAEDLYELVHLANEAPPELTVMIRMMAASRLPFLPEDIKVKAVIGVSFCYCGDLAKGEEVMAPFRKVGTIITDTLLPQPYLNLLETHEGRVGYVGKSAYMSTFDMERAELLTSIVNGEESPLSPAVGMRILGGAVTELPEESSTYSHRDKPYLIQTHTFYMTPEQAPAAKERMAKVFDQIEPYVEGVDVNLMGNQGPVPLTDVYSRDNLERLIELKKQYDPENIFNQNINIPPHFKLE